MKKKILVTGSNGQLGMELKILSSSFQQFDFIFVSKEDLPIHQSETVRNYFKEHHPHYLINCAAYTAVDKAEIEKDIAFHVNAEAVELLSLVCKEHHTSFIHISSDYVFDGTATTPYKEDSPTNPQSVYGASKLAGEKLAIQHNSDSIIIRTSWVYSEFGKNFVKTMLKLMSERDEINVVSDQMGSPTYAADLAEGIMKIIDGGNWQPGIYNFSNVGVISWFDFAVAISNATSLTCKVNPIPTSQYPTPAKRPAWSVLDKTKIQQTFDIKPTDWKQSLLVCLSRLK
ncbi:MAG: dTDP-4-dehydrorhamnose reductase [Ginsengibacter sp.]